MKALLSERGLMALTVSALLSLTAAIWAYMPTDPSGGVEPGTYLIQGLNPEAVADIVLTGDTGDTVTLTRSDAGYTIAEAHGYPADDQAVQTLLLSLLDLRINRQITDDPGAHAELGVADDSAGSAETPTVATMLAKLHDDSGAPILTVRLGGYPATGGGRYVRLNDDPEVFLTQSSISPALAPTSYADRVLTDFEESEIQRVRVTPVDGPSYRLEAGEAEGEDPVLSPVPQGQQPIGTELGSTFRAAVGLRFDDVLPATGSGAPSVTWQATHTTELSRPLRYAIRVGETDDGQAVLALQAEGPGPQAVQEAAATLRQNSDNAQLQAIDDVMTAAEEARSFNAIHADWLFAVTSWKADSLRAELIELVEDAAEPEPVPMPEPAMEPLPEMDGSATPDTTSADTTPETSAATQPVE